MIPASDVIKYAIKNIHLLGWSKEPSSMGALTITEALKAGASTFISPLFYETYNELYQKAIGYVMRAIEVKGYPYTFSSAPLEHNVEDYNKRIIPTQIEAVLLLDLAFTLASEEEVPNDV